MSMQYFFNLHDLTQGIGRQLAEGMETRIFPGDNVMISVVRIAPGTAGDIHAHPEEQWGVLLEGSGIRVHDGRDHRVTASLR